MDIPEKSRCGVCGEDSVKPIRLPVKTQHGGVDGETAVVHVCTNLRCPSNTRSRNRDEVV